MMTAHLSLLLLVMTLVGQTSAMLDHSGTLDVEESLRLKRSTNKQDETKRVFTSAEKQFLVDKHNEYRRIPNAADMLYMSWDSELENLAQSHADKCVWAHNKERLIPSTGKKAGENMHIVTSSYNENGTMVAWYSEEVDYTYSDNTCRSGKACGHYTQVIWAKSEAVGCGIRFCASVEGISFKNAYITICNYRPAGNFLGVKPYIKGTACSACPAGKQKCENGLCRDGSGEVKTTQKPITTSKKPVTTKRPSTTKKPETTTEAANEVTTKETSTGTCVFSSLMLTVTVLIVNVAVRAVDETLFN